MSRPKTKEAPITAGAALAAVRWEGHTREPTQPRRLRLTTIERVQRHAAAIGSTFDSAIIDLLQRHADRE